MKEQEREKWYDRVIDFAFLYYKPICIAIFVIGGTLYYLNLKGNVDDMKSEIQTLKTNRNNALVNYFQTENYILLQSYGDNAYLVQTEKGEFVVQFSDDYSKVLKSLQK